MLLRGCLRFSSLRLSLPAASEPHYILEWPSFFDHPGPQNSDTSLVRMCSCEHACAYESRGWHQVSSSMTFTFTFFETGSLTKPVVGQWAAAILLSPTPQCWAHRIYILPWVKANVTVTHAVPKQVISAIEAGRRCWHGVADLLGSRCLCEFQLMSSLPHFLTVSDRLTAAVQPGLEAKGEQSSCRDTSAGDTDILQLAGG